MGQKESVRLLWICALAGSLLASGPAAGPVGIADPRRRMQAIGTLVRSIRREPGLEGMSVLAPALARVADLYARSTPALIRCGWGLERNRNGGNAAMAVLALPAVGGKFGVRGGGYSMSNSASSGRSG